MPRSKGIAYWIDDAWRVAVRKRLSDLGWDALKLSKESKVGASTISEMLSGESHSCVKLPAIHKALGFPPPCPPLLPERVRRIMAAFDGLGGSDVEEGFLVAVEAQLFRRK